MRRVGVLATVEWRAESFKRTVDSLNAQTARLDEILVIYDGFKGVLPRMTTVDDVHVTTTDTPSGGGWARLNMALHTFDRDPLLFVFDDDMVYPPTYVEELYASYTRHQTPIALSGRRTTGNYTFYTDKRDRDLTLTEPHLGVSAFPLAALCGIHNDPHFDMLKNWEVEIFLGYWWWKKRVTIIRPKGDVAPDYDRVTAVDSRSVFAQTGRGMEHEFREKLKERTGYTQ